MLSAIAGSMITVAGVVFSITIVAIAFAAGQYGPRVLTNFMRDRGNQLTLGTFIATFVYSLVVLRTIHSGDSSFVPQFAVLLGIFLALCSIALLIFFVHHVPSSIHVNSVIARIGRRLVGQIGQRRPLGSNEQEPAPSAPGATGGSVEVADVRCHDDGYVDGLDEERIIEIASRHDLRLRILCAPGDFAFRGRALMEVSPAARLSEECRDELRGAYTIGTSRLPTQDLLFLVDELVEITARALSTGINDPYTAITCLDWLGAAVAQMTRRGRDPDERRDRQGEVRVIVPTANFETLVERGFGRARPYVGGDVNAARHALRTLSLSARVCRMRQQMQTLRAEAEALTTTAEALLEAPLLAAVNEAKRAADAVFDQQAKQLGD